MDPIGYEVINPANGRSHGVFASRELARGRVRFDKLASYQIWSGSYDGVGFVRAVCVESCDPYEGDDEPPVHSFHPDAEASLAFDNEAEENQERDTQQSSRNPTGPERPRRCTADCAQARSLYAGDRISYADYRWPLCPEHAAVETLRQVILAIDQPGQQTLHRTARVIVAAREALQVLDGEYFWPYDGENGGVYEAQGFFCFDFAGVQHGPFATEEEAEEAYDQVQHPPSEPSPAGQLRTAEAILADLARLRATEEREPVIALYREAEALLREHCADAELRG